MAVSNNANDKYVLRYRPAVVQVSIVLELGGLLTPASTSTIPSRLTKVYEVERRPAYA